MQESKQKIILINPPLFYADGQPHVLDASVPPLGLIYLATFINCQSDKWQASVLDVGPEGEILEKTLQRIKELKPAVVGITCMTPQLQGALELAKEIKNNFSEIKISLGGPHVSGDPDFVNRFSDIFDFAITGEGETVLLQLLNKISENQNVRGVFKGEPIKNLDELPIPDKSLIKRSLYAKHESIMASRGCPFNCYYCSRPAVDRLLRYRSPENILEEIKKTYAYSEGFFHFQDDTFTMLKEKALEICQKIYSSGLKVKWQCNTRIDRIDEELISQMSRAGCELINFGIESGNERIRREVIHKPFGNKEIIEKFKLCRKYGIKVACYFMLGHPTETQETLQETKRFILKNKYIDIVGLSIPTPFPGSALYEIAKSEGIINEKIIDDFANKKLGEGYAGNYPVYVAPGLNKTKLLNLRKTILRSFYLRPKLILKKIGEDLSSWNLLKKDIQDGLSVVFRGSSSRQPYKEKEGEQIVIVSPFSPPNMGGVETHLKYLSDYLRQKNIDTQIITYRPLTTQVANWKRKEQEGSVSITRIRWFGHNLFEKFAKNPLLEFLYITPGLLFGTLWYSLKNRKKIKCFHAHGLAAGFVVRVVNLFFQKKTVLSTHFIYGLEKRAFFSKIVFWVFKGFDRILPIGQESQDELTKAGLNSSKMMLFKHWIDNKNLFISKENKMEIRKNLGLPEEKTIVLFVGRLMKMKGIDFLLEAAEKNSNFVFVFVGSGEMEEKIKEKDGKLRNIFYAGKKFGKELVEYYNAADMVALPSVEEGSSLVVIEALSCGKPMIITNLGCSKDMFEDYLGEKIIPSAENILSAIEKIIQKKSTDPLFEKKCREFALLNYSEKNAEDIINNYI